MKRITREGRPDELLNFEPLCPICGKVLVDGWTQFRGFRIRNGLLPRYECGTQWCQFMRPWPPDRSTYVLDVRCKARES